MPTAPDVGRELARKRAMREESWMREVVKMDDSLVRLDVEERRPRVEMDVDPFCEHRKRSFLKRATSGCLFSIEIRHASRKEWV